MALTAREAALIAASKVTTQRVSAVADIYEDWIDDQVTEADAILALLEASGRSKSPSVVLAHADTAYEAVESDPATITSITPATGAAAGGTAFELVGTNFTEVSGVTLGGVAATSVVVVDDQHITGVTGAHAAGAVDVVAVHAEGNGTLTNGFTYA